MAQAFVQDEAMTPKISTSKDVQDESVILQNSRSVAHRDLPPIPKGADNGDYGTILLCYQYKEPLWTKKEHKKTLKKCIELGEKFQVMFDNFVEASKSDRHLSSRRR